MNKNLYLKALFPFILAYYCFILSPYSVGMELNRDITWYDSQDQDIAIALEMGNLCEININKELT